jgi:pyridoxamine 5'-phosphate oxidase
MDLKSVREEYESHPLEIKDLNSNPILELKKWFQAALDHNLSVANACHLSTIGLNGFPQNRVILAKEIQEDGIVFFSHYESKKAMELEANPRASLTFFWKEFNRQVRVWGEVQKTTAQESKDYFKSRPFESQIAAISATQSQPITQQALHQSFNQLKEKYTNQELKAPSNWGGYILKPGGYEFWQGRPSRLHDRFFYKYELNSWKIERLAP